MRYSRMIFDSQVGWNAKDDGWEIVWQSCFCKWYILQILPGPRGNTVLTSSLASNHCALLCLTIHGWGKRKKNLCDKEPSFLYDSELSHKFQLLIFFSSCSPAQLCYCISNQKGFKQHSGWSEARPQQRCYSTVFTFVDLWCSLYYLWDPYFAVWSSLFI